MRPRPWAASGRGGSRIIRPARGARPPLRTLALVFALGVSAALAACTATPVPATGEPTDEAGASAPASSAPPATGEEQADTISPLVISALAPDPVPVPGSDDLIHVAYELTVLNFGPRPATLTAVETLGPEGDVLASLDAGEAAPGPSSSRTMEDAPMTRCRSRPERPRCGCSTTPMRIRTPCPMRSHIA